MRKSIVALVLATTMTTALGYDFSGNSFVSIKPVFQTASPEKEALWHYDWLDKCEDGYCGSIEIVPLGGATFGDELGKFLGLFGKTTLRVKEFKSSVPSSTTDLQPDKDLEARHFNIETKSADKVFESVIDFNPVHEFVGVGIAYRQRFNECYWGEISFPIVRVTHEIVFKEDVKERAGGAVEEDGLDGLPRVGTVTEALENWKVGRWEPNVKHDKTGIGDLELKLGWETYDNGKAHLRSYIGGVFPTGNKPDPELFFPPVVGNNQHYGVMFGGNVGFELWCYGEHRLRQETDTMGRYLFPNNQFRAFDLSDKQWSRYQEVYSSEGAAQGANARSGTSGINVFIREVEVRPRFSTTINTALIYSYCDGFIAEIGYNFFARQGEEIEFPDDKCGIKCDTEIALKHVNGNGLTSRSRNIKDNFEGDSIALADYTPLNCREFDINSAAHPPMISQIFYGAIGYECNDWCYPTSFSVGGSYEWAHNCAGLKRWMAWGKLAFCF